jgi:hypothetical protein
MRFSSRTCASVVNLRATPARNGRLLMKINLGEKVTTDGKTYGEWTHVMYKNSVDGCSPGS